MNKAGLALLALALAAAPPARAQPEALPPPPPPPSADLPAPPPPPGALPQREPPPESPAPGAPQGTQPAAPAGPATAAQAAEHRGPRGVIGEGLQAPAGAPAAPLQPDERVSNWRFSLASGIVGRWGGLQLSSTSENAPLMLYFGGQADGLWSPGYGQAARLRVRLLTGGEGIIFLPSDGEVEAAYMVGRREFRFVIGRVEVGRYPALGIQAWAQVATLPCFEGSLSLAGDRMRLYYYISPVEASWVHYTGPTHIASQPGWPSESSRVDPASAFRARYSVMVPPSVLLDVLLRWDSVTRRGLQIDTTETASQLMLMAVASLTF